MLRTVLTVIATAIFVSVIFLYGGKMLPVQGAAPPGAGFAAVPGTKGGQDIWGPYEVVADWPKPLSSMPGHDPKWSWGSAEGIYAESPNRVYLFERGVRGSTEVKRTKPGSRGTGFAAGSYLKEKGEVSL